MNKNLSHKGQTNGNYKDGRTINKVCEICGKKVNEYRSFTCSLKCRKIRNKLNKLNIGKNNGNYKDGKTLKDYFCKDCGKKLVKISAQRCSSCSAIERFKHEVSPARIDGRSTTKHYCIKCKVNEISYVNWRIGQQRCQSCAKLGEENSLYIHGNGYKPYPLEFNKRLKEFIRDRDNHKCQKCNMTEEDNGRKLDVHHIDYNKMNCIDTNLISLCSSCNIKANFERDYYFAYFTAIMEEITQCLLI